MRFALDQTIPPLVLDVASYFPDVELAPLAEIDRRLCDLDDRELIIGLRQTGWHGLVTTNYKMLWVPIEISAVVKAGIAVFAIQDVGDDPLRATGAILLHLPAVLKRVIVGEPQIFRTNPNAPTPEDAWDYFRQAADRLGTDAEILYSQVKVTDDELTTPVLS